MFLNQISVFLENRAGRLDEVLETLKVNNINILSLSLADTSDYGLLRMIVSDSEKCKANSHQRRIRLAFCTFCRKTDAFRQLFSEF